MNTLYTSKIAFNKLIFQIPIILIFPLFFGGCAKHDNPYLASNAQINEILLQVDSQFDSLPIIYILPERYYNQNSEDLIDNHEIDSIIFFQKNLGLPSEYIPHIWGFTAEQFAANTQLNASNVFLSFDSVNLLSISSKINHLSTAETFTIPVVQSLNEYNTKQQLILQKTIEIQILTSDSLKNFIRNITHQRKNKWISKSAYDAFLTNARETFAEYFRLKCTEAKLDIQSSINLKLLLDQLSSDLSEKHWDLIVSQLRKK